MCFRLKKAALNVYEVYRFELKYGSRDTVDKLTSKYLLVPSQVCAEKSWLH